MINKDIIVERMVEVMNNLISDIDNASEYSEDFDIIREVAEQLKDELNAL